MGAVYNPQTIDLRNEPSWQDYAGDLLNQFVNIYAKRKRQKEIDDQLKKAKEQGYKVKTTYDEDGNRKYEISEPENSAEDLLKMMKYKEAQKYVTDKGIDWQNMPDEVKKMLGADIERKNDFSGFLDMIAGIKSPEEVLPQKQLSAIQNRIAPLSLGQAEGGEVLTLPQATYRDGGIYSPSGLIGEYLQGYEPKPAPQAVTSSDVTDFLKMFAGQQAGVSPEELVRDIWKKKIGVETPNIREQVLREVAKSKELSPGEQKIYNLIDREALFSSMINSIISENLNAVSQDINPKVGERINALRSIGWEDKDIINALREKGINPVIYGLK